MQKCIPENKIPENSNKFSKECSSNIVRYFQDPIKTAYTFPIKMSLTMWQSRELSLIVYRKWFRHIHFKKDIQFGQVGLRVGSLIRSVFAKFGIWVGKKCKFDNLFEFRWAMDQKWYAALFFSHFIICLFSSLVFGSTLKVKLYHQIYIPFKSNPKFSRCFWLWPF